MAERERRQEYYAATQLGLRQMWNAWQSEHDKNIWGRISEFLTSQAAKYFPRASVHHAPPRWATPNYAALRKERGQCWMQIYTMSQHEQLPSCHNVLCWWRLLTRHQRLMRQMRGLAQQLRAQHLDRHLQQAAAAAAAQQGNSRVYWSLIKRLTPKTR